MKHIVLSAAIVMLSAGYASADLLVPGQTQYRPGSGGPPNYSIAAAPSAGGLLASMSSPINSMGAGSFVGTIQSFVWDWDAGPGVQLSFGYVITSTVNSTRDIVRVTYDGPWTNIAILEAGADSSGTAGHALSGDPRSIFRTVLANQAPTSEFFSDTDLVGDPLSPGEVSSIIWFRTDATAFTQGSAGFSDSGTVGVGNIFAPVPSPATLPTLLLSLTALARRRR
jgi:hypothetical protein